MDSIRKRGLEGHFPFGTYLYGEITDGGYLHHVDGRPTLSVP